MLKQLLIHWLGLVANWVYHQPRLKQLALTLVHKLPPSLEDRLRYGITRGNRNNTNKDACVVIDPMSACEQRILRDLRLRHKNNGVHADKKPRLAYFSPLPPEKSGISHYSLMLIPELAKHYQIDVIVNQDNVDNLPEIDAICTIHTYEQFCTQTEQYHRILYHIGNSHFHSHMFHALENCPGVVVLHDFFLGHVIRHMDMFQPGFLAKNLYQDWGLTALKPLKDPLKSEALIWNCPLNGVVMQHAYGIIAHSAFSAQLTHQYYGDACQQQWRFIPHLRKAAPPCDRQKVRQTLGIPADAFVVCSFGHITPTKLHDRILNAWHSSKLDDNEQCWLVFVGENAGGAHGRLLNQLIKHSNNPRIRVTGWADTDTFEHYLGAADVAVQLRSKSRGETSGAVIDCMNHGLATIVNAHGTMIDLPDNSVYKLPDEVNEAALVAALENLYFDPAHRKQLGNAARQTILQQHDPEICGHQYKQAIEQFYAQRQTYNNQLDEALALLSDDDLAHGRIGPSMATLSDSAPKNLQPRQLLVDVSAIAKTDLKTGIERVVRAQLSGLIDNPPDGFRVEPVYLHYIEGSWQYQYAHNYGFQLTEVPYISLSDEKVSFSSGDILYMPDLNAHSMIRATESGLFTRLKESGVSVHCLIHDILPVTHPEFFPSNASVMHHKWLMSITKIADQIICISHAVANQYVEWARKERFNTNLPFIAVNHHGADIDATQPTRGYPRHGKSILKKLSSGITFVMVGTIEPRKGHLDAITAFDTLWKDGENINLIIIGKEGWKGLPVDERKNIPETIKKLDWHPLRNKKLFWLSDVSDEFLEAVYDHSNCLLAASFDEGFGLPLIEAARHNLAIVARDIPVFREVAGENACYFTNNDLTSVIRDWLKTREKATGLDGNNMQIRTWADNIDDLKSLLMTKNGIPDEQSLANQTQGVY